MTVPYLTIWVRRLKKGFSRDSRVDAHMIKKMISNKISHAFIVRVRSIQYAFLSTSPNPMTNQLPAISSGNGTSYSVSAFVISFSENLLHDGLRDREAA